MIISMFCFIGHWTFAFLKSKSVNYKAGALMNNRWLKSESGSPLLIEFNREGINFFGGGVFHGCLEVTRQFEMRQGESATNPSESLVQSFCEHLTSLNLDKSSGAIVCVPRSICCLHRIDLSAVQSDLLPSAVALEMESLYGDEVEEFVWDYVVSSAPVGEAGYVVNVYCIPKRFLGYIDSLCKQAKVEVQRVTLMEFALSRSCESERLGVTQLIALRPGSVELLACHRGFILQSQSLSIDETQECRFDLLVGTFRRLLATLPGGVAGVSGGKVLRVFQSDWESERSATYRDSLVEACQGAGFLLEKHNLSDELKSFASFGQGEIDFANPKRPSKNKMNSKVKASIGAFVLLIAIVSSVGYSRYRSVHLTELLEMRESEVAEVERELSSLEDKLSAAHCLRDWKKAAVRWDEQIALISQPFASSESLYLVRMQMDSPRGEDGRPLTRIEGRSKSPDDILALTRELAVNNRGLSVQPNHIEPSSIDPSFGSQFRVEISSLVGDDSVTTAAPEVMLETEEI